MVKENEEKVKENEANKTMADCVDFKLADI